MPCSQRKARILLKQNKAKVYKYNPFAIQLTIATGETKQDLLYWSRYRFKVYWTCSNLRGQGSV